MTPTTTKATGTVTGTGTGTGTTASKIPENREVQPYAYLESKAGALRR